MGKFCDFITDPDWWGVLLSAISTIAVIVIAVVQIRLQKRQTEAQDFDVYRKLYPLVYSANNRIIHFMDDMWAALWKPTYRFDGESFLSVRINEIDRLIKELSQNRIDFELKFPKEFFDLNGYIEVLFRMSVIGHYIEDAIIHQKVIVAEGVHRGTADLKLDIAKHFIDKGEQQIIIQYFDKYVAAKNNIHSSVDVLEEIKKRCKID